MQGVTFPVSPEVKRGRPGKYELIEARRAIDGTPGAVAQVEACGSNQVHLIHANTQMNGFLRAIHMAFAEHYPLVLSPDDVWLAIAQGFAHHVNANAEKLCKHFVRHEGQKYIEVQRDMFVKGSPSNDWPGAFAEFSDKIAEHIGDAKRRMVVSKFSTTGPIERAASEVVLMDAMKAYFSYSMKTCCGIPEVTLLGTEDDWHDIKDRVHAFAEFGATEWVTALTGVLWHFVDAYKGRADPKFWQSFYKEGGGSGGPYVTGAVNTFFPYLTTYRGGVKEFNKWALQTDWDKRFKRFGFGGGPCSDDFPQGLSSVPFVWHYHGQPLDMSFLGGFVGTSQDPETGALRPAIGWGIADRKPAR